jgi:hypothetical protein
MRILTICLLAGLAFPRIAAADAPGAGKMPFPGVLAFGDRNPSCREWSDGCVICLRGADGSHCSTPGIACQPGQLRCKQSAK